MRRVTALPCFLLALLAAFSPPAHAQDFLAALRMDSLDWTAVDRAHPRPAEPALRGLGVCANQAHMGAQFHAYHYLNVDGDGRLDLVYSGPTTFCETNAEGSTTTVDLDRGPRLVRAMRANGWIAGYWRVAPWEPLTFVVHTDGCCGDPFRTLQVWHPRRTADGWRYEASAEVATQYATVLPRAAWTAPKPFTVAQDGYKLRTAPVVDDTSENEGLEPGARGNTQARFAPGSRGIALAEQADATGRVWWFVVMQAPAAGEKPVPGGAPYWHAGWMSSRFLTSDPGIPTGRVDPEPPLGTRR
jgi:hypothetical protein